MPCYDYRCSACDHQFEILLSISRRGEPETQPCPHCDVEGVVKFQLTRAPGLVSTAYTNLRPPSDFKDLLNKMKKGNPRSNIDV